MSTHSVIGYMEASQVRRHAAFIGFNVLLAGFGLERFQQLYAFSSQNVHYSHMILIPFVSVYLLYSNREELFHASRVQLMTGLPVVALGLILFPAGRSLLGDLPENDLLALFGYSYFFIWIGGFLALYGLSTLRKAAFPVLFLIFLVPIPTPVLDGIVFFLQKSSAEVVAVLLNLTGPVFREGDFFSLPGLTIHVAPQCSGIRSGISLFITSLLGGYLFLRSFWARTALAAIAIPVTIIKNGLRITTLVLLSIHVDRDFLTGDLHTQGGYPFFVLALAMLGPVVWLLRRAERSKTATESGPSPD